jgi:hypothetical protein
MMKQEGCSRLIFITLNLGITPMKLSCISLSVVAIVAGSLSIFSSSAQAFQFKSNITQSLSGKDAAQGDILLKSVDLKLSSTSAVTENRTKFSLVNKATLIQNDQLKYDAKGKLIVNSGAASADKGDKATVGLVQEDLTAAGLVTALNNPYLSSIIDTEDSGFFTFDLFFDKVADNVLFWERGMNSSADIQAFDLSGKAGKVVTVGPKGPQGTKTAYQYSAAGYKLDTTEINGAQDVGSLGLSLSDFGLTKSIAKVRITTKGSAYNGPDFKLMGTADLKALNAKPTPEPSLALGLGAAVLVGGLRKRSRKIA